MMLLRLTGMPVAVAAICLCLPLPSLAADADAKFEITPFAAYRVGGSFDDTDDNGRLELQESGSWGLSINGRVEANTEWELFYARQSTNVDSTGLITPQTSVDVDVDLLHFGGTYLFDGERVRPFIALTVGATRFDPLPSSFNAKTYASVSLGGGWKFRLAEHFGVRLEVRGFGTFVDSNSRLFCVSDGGAECLIIAEGDFVTQWEARAGLSLRF